MWTGNNNQLTSFFTASLTSPAKEYWVDVYNTGSTQSGSSVQFSIQYGHVNGSGSAYINPSVASYSPTRVVYGEYRNLVFGTETQNFQINSSTQDIFIINLARARYKESVYPGSLLLALSGSGGLKYFMDDSATATTTNFIGENIYYNVYETGSNTNVGYLFPNLDIIILDPSLLNNLGVCALPTRTANTNSTNALLLFNSIKLGANFTLQSQETISSRYFFTRIKNSEFNYTTNPSIIDSNGNLLYNSLVNNPQTYITTVGMYNDNNELLAVAKLSKPLVKDFTKEALVRIKLDY
jgi:hypothetical protein